MTPLHGDFELAERASKRLGRHHERFVVAQVCGGTTATASGGLALDADVEIGSVSKGLTGLLYTDARDRAEVHDTMRLDELLPLDGTPVGEVTLGALALHRSGLPRLAKGSGAVRGTADLMTRGTNPYGETLEQLLVRARRTPVGAPRPRYSNLGFMLLGHAVASAAGRTYAGLLAERLTGVLGMSATTVPASPDELRPNAVVGHGRGGRPREAWSGEALGPAGGIRSTAADLERLLTALLHGAAPGVGALDPVADFQGSRLRIGASWLTLEPPRRRRHPGGRVTWHNGGTGGFRSMVALDRAAGAGVAVVSACTRSVDGPTMALLLDTLDRTVAGGG